MLNERGRDLQFLQDQNDRLFRTNKKLSERIEELQCSQFELSFQANDFQENEFIVISFKDSISFFLCIYTNIFSLLIYT